jgi:hypothetical protein
MKGNPSAAYCSVFDQPLAYQGRRFAKRSFTVLVILLITFVAFPTLQASAGAPFFEVITFDETFARSDLSDACGFPVNEHLQGSFTDTVFTDADGNVTRVLERYNIQSMYFSANGHIVAVKNANGPLRVINYPDGSYTLYFVGTIDFTTTRGSGVVYGSAGQTILNFSATDELLSAESRGKTIDDLTAFCTALAP